MQNHAFWKNATLEIVTQGEDKNKGPTFLLHDRLQTRLGLSRQKQPANPQDKRTVLKILLEPIVHALVAEDRSGRADQHRVTIRARPVIEGIKDAPTYPVIKSSSTYYEPRISTSVEATRKRAEAEALERLTDTLIAMLKVGFEP